MIIEDSSNVPYTYKGSHDTYLQVRRQRAQARSGRAGALSRAGDEASRPRADAVGVASIRPICWRGWSTRSTTSTEGRIGWNCVTGSNDGAAQNYGRDKHRPHDERYDVADEFADVVTRLWEAWEPDAVVLDRETPMFADGSKVHPINHEGKYFKCRGPLNAPRSPQGRVPICQAGGSPRGQRFASRWADTIITDGGGTVAA